MQKSALTRWKKKIQRGGLSDQAIQTLLENYGLPLDRWTEGIRKGNEALLRKYEIPVAPSIDEGFFMAKKPLIRTPLHDLYAKAVAKYVRSGNIGYFTFPKLPGGTRTVIMADKALFDKFMRKFSVPEHLREASRQAVLRHEIYESLLANKTADQLIAELGRILPGIREGKSSREIIATLGNAYHNYFKNRTFSHFGPKVLEQEAEMVATSPPEIQNIFTEMRGRSGEAEAWRKAIDATYPYIPAGKRRELREFLAGLHPASRGTVALRNAALSFTRSHPNVTRALDSALRFAGRFIPR